MNDEFSIIVVNFTGKRSPLKVNMKTTIKELKQIILKSNKNYNDVLIKFDGVQIQDESKTINDYHITANCMIMALVTLHSGDIQVGE